MRGRPVVASLVVVLLSTAVTWAQEPQPEGPPPAPDPQPIFAGPDTFLAQPVNLTGCLYSSGTPTPQIFADNVMVSGLPVMVDEVIVWVTYFAGNVPPTPSPTVRFYTDGGSVPGTLILEQFAVPTVQVDTGLNDGRDGLDVYQLTMSLVTPVQLDPGANWVEVTDESGGAGNRNCWEHGQLDGVDGILNSAWSSQDPPQTWVQYAQDMAVQLTGNIVPVELESFEIER